jgi:hypothetical protein
MEMVSSSKPHRPELQLEVALVPDQGAIQRPLAAQLAELGVLEPAHVEVDGPTLTEGRREVQHAALAADVDGLEQVHQAHVRERAAEAGLGLHALALEAHALTALQLEVHARDDLFDVDGLGQVVLHAELEALDLALHRAVAREEHEGDLAGVLALAQPLHQLEPVHVRQAGVADDHIGATQPDHLDGRERVGARGHAVAGLAQADLQHAQAALVGVDEEEVLLGHGL